MNIQNYAIIYVSISIPSSYSLLQFHSSHPLTGKASNPLIIPSPPSRTDLSDDEIHFILHEGFHLRPDIRLHRLLAQPLSVGGTLGHAASHKDVPLCSHLMGDPAGVLVDLGTLFWRRRVGLF